jgi:hypothetical protein
MRRARRIDERVLGFGFWVLGLGFSELVFEISLLPPFFPGGRGVGGEGLRHAEPGLDDGYRDGERWRRTGTPGISIPGSAPGVAVGRAVRQRVGAFHPSGWAPWQGWHPALRPVRRSLRTSQLQPGSCLSPGVYARATPARRVPHAQPVHWEGGRIAMRRGSDIGGVVGRRRTHCNASLQLLALLTTHVSRLTTPYD